MSRLGKYSLGIGDRFARQGKYQLEAFVEAQKGGVEVTPVWNKSYREHQTVKSKPESVLQEADHATEKLGWINSYMVDADHITLKTVDEFLNTSDFFTIDVAEQIDQQLDHDELSKFMQRYRSLLGTIQIDGVPEAFQVDEDLLAQIGHRFYIAAREACVIYRHIKEQKGTDQFAVEISMDEVESPQSPLEMLFILKLLADEGVPVDTIAPKFTGRFNKGIDYEGDIDLFTKEFEQDLLVIKHAVVHFGLPENLKLSVHTGSDKFALYPIINRLIRKHDCGIHLKTAGTTWLEECIGLSEAGGSALSMIKGIYKESLTRYEELTVPYHTVLNIERDQLPSPDTVYNWTNEEMVAALSHDQQNTLYNPHMRQLMHTAYKIAAERGESFLRELKVNEAIVGKHVKENILVRHLNPLFL